MRYLAIFASLLLSTYSLPSFSELTSESTLLFRSPAVSGKDPKWKYGPSIANDVKLKARFDKAWHNIQTLLLPVGAKLSFQPVSRNYAALYLPPGDPRDGVYDKDFYLERYSALFQYLRDSDEPQNFHGHRLSNPDWSKVILSINTKKSRNFRFLAVQTPEKTEQVTFWPSALAMKHLDEVKTDRDYPSDDIACFEDVVLASLLAQSFTDPIFNVDINGQKPQLPESKNEFQGKHPGAKRAAQVKIGMNNKAGDRVLIPLDTPYRTQFMAKAAHDGRKTQDTRVDEIFWNAWTGVFILKDLYFRRQRNRLFQPAQVQGDKQLMTLLGYTLEEMQRATYEQGQQDDEMYYDDDAGFQD